MIEKKQYIDISSEYSILKDTSGKTPRFFVLNFIHVRLRVENALWIARLHYKIYVDTMQNQCSNYFQLNSELETINLELHFSL